MKVVVENIDVKFHSSFTKKDDNDVANEIINAYKWNMEVPNDKIKVKVEKGFVTLDGEVFWNFQKNAAKNAVSKLMCVTGVLNNITIKSESKDKVEKDNIVDALNRNWSLREQDIEVEVSNHKVTLMGKVDSWYQKDEAARMVWNAEGVWTVDNKLEVEFENELMD